MTRAEFEEWTQDLARWADAGHEQEALETLEALLRLEGDLPPKKCDG